MAAFVSGVKEVKVRIIQLEEELNKEGMEEEEKEEEEEGEAMMESEVDWWKEIADRMKVAHLDLNLDLSHQMEGEDMMKPHLPTHFSVLTAQCSHWTREISF